MLFTRCFARGRNRPLRPPASAWLLVLMMLSSNVARARPNAPSVLCKAEPEIAVCAGGVPSCALCHEGTDPPSWNAFGMDVKRELSGNQSFDAQLPSALEAVADEDSDGDGMSNRDELLRGSQPGIKDVATGAEGGPAEAKNPRYRVGQYDYVFAFRRVAILFCARSPSYDEQQAFTAGAPDDATLKSRLHEKLSACIKSAYWQKEALSRLGDKRIRPLTAAGPDSNIQIAGYRLVIGDYNYDYRLFRYALTEDRDMRELLTADYHVTEDAQGTLAPVRGILEKSDEKALAGGQLVPEERRAGMLTTQWFLAINTMFSALPRTTAAQAYRSYLGADISNGEGLRPVDGEPLDVDKKGVAAARCANCHATLDPLAYVFTEYEGINMTADLAFGVYMPERPRERIPGWDMTKQKAVLLGTPVKDLVEWSQVAAKSDEFKRAMVEMFFHHAFGRAPLADEQEDFIALWRAVPDMKYSANQILHGLVDLPSFGRP